MGNDAGDGRSAGKRGIGPEDGASGIDRLKLITDWEQYGGAPLLGFEHLLLKAHGRSGERAVANAIRVAAKAERGRLCEKIGTGMAELAALGPAPRAK